MKKKILLILLHPNPQSFNEALLQAYQNGAREVGLETEVISIQELGLNAAEGVDFKNLHPSKKVLEAQAKIKAAEHLVIFHPLWWGGLPAAGKDFFDKVFLPGFAFKYRKDSPWWDKYLKGKSARVVCTADQPYFYYWLVNHRVGYRQLRKTILNYCGIKPVNLTFFGPIRSSDEKAREKMKNKMYELGKNGK